MAEYTECILDSLEEHHGIQPTMSNAFIKCEGYTTIFHADLNKLIYYWRFDGLCQPSFINPNEKCARWNPKVVYNDTPNGLKNDFISIFKKRKIEYDYDTAQVALKKDIKTNGNYLDSKRYKNNWDWLYFTGQDKDIAYPMVMPSVGFEKSSHEERYSILELTSDKNVSVIESSSFKIRVEAGRNRIRFLEYIGAKDIYILVQPHQLHWFQEHCLYKTD